MKILAIAALMASAILGQITVYSSGSLAIGTTKQLTAYVPLVVNTVTWSVNGVVGGDSTYGTVSTTGLYSAPAAVPAANAVSVRATSTGRGSGPRGSRGDVPERRGRRRGRSSGERDES